MEGLSQLGTPGLYSGFNPETGQFDKPVIGLPKGKSKFKMGLGSFVKKIVKAPTKVVTSVAKVGEKLGTSAIDAGTKVVEGTGQVASDIYSGTKKSIGSVGRGVESLGSATVKGAEGILSDPVSLVGVATGNPALIIGGQALKSVGSSGAFVDPSGNVVTLGPTGQPQIIQTPMGLPGSQPIPFQQSFRSGNDDKQAFDFTTLLPIAIGGLGVYILTRGKK
jgi:hypothetical protein